jgi:hypothetical protein
MWIVESVIVYFRPQITQIYTDFRLQITQIYTDFRSQITQIYTDFRSQIFTDIRSSWIFKDSFLRVGKNDTNKGRIDKKYKKLFCNLSVECLFCNHSYVVNLRR